METKPTATLQEITIKDHPISLKLDDKLSILFATDYFSEISAYEIYDLIGKNIDLIRHPETPKTISNLLWEDLLTHKNTQIITKFLTKKGDFYWLNMTFEFKNGFIYVDCRKVKNSAKLALSRLYKKLYNIEQHSKIIVAENYLEGILEQENMDYKNFMKHHS